MPAISLGEDLAVARLHGWRGAILACIVAVTGCGGGDGGGASTPAPPATPTRLVLVANSHPNENSVSIFTLDATSGALTRHPSSPYSGGLGLSPTSVAVTPSGRFAYVTSSNAGGVSALKLDPGNGAITVVATSPCAAALTPQFVAVEPTGRFAYVALPSDTVEAYAINAGTGALTCIAGGAGEVPRSSPRHVAFDPSGRFAYVANGTSNNITIYTIDQTTGALTLLQMVSIPSTPPDAPLPVSIAVDPLARFAYVTNSGTNDISAFALDPNTGALAELIGSPIGVAGSPNSVALEPSGRFAYVANLLANTISVFDIDANSGLLSLNGDTPLPTNSGPRSLVVDPSGKFVYVTLSSIDKVAAFRIDPTSGALTQVNGSPFDTGLTPLGVVATGAIQ